MTTTVAAMPTPAPAADPFGLDLMVITDVPDGHALSACTTNDGCAPSCASSCISNGM
ncbi:FxLD family lanthipeptide [Allokutzneria multivorans]|uniref:FxLD family lanthipeptide n=1 Tax=Allokutzneria multivorans TaxID=1142134 RepID=UPI0031F151E6